MRKFWDGDRSAAEVSLNLIDIGIGKIIGDDYLAFVNVTRNFILNGNCRSLPAESVIIVVPEGISADFDIVQKLEELRLAGHSVALDNFVYQECLKPLAELG